MREAVPGQLAAANALTGSLRWVGRGCWAGDGGLFCLSTQGCVAAQLTCLLSPLQQTRAEPAAPFPRQHVANLFSGAQ